MKTALPEIRKPETKAVHYYKDGKSACPISEEYGAPTISWPPGHVWSQRWEDVTCADCLKAKPDSE